MSFGNTVTPRKPDGVAKWQVPQRRSATGPMEFYLEGELEERFRKLFPKHSNVRIMEWFGISFSTMQRFKRELGLEKDMKAIRRELAKDVKKICENNGYYDSLRGKAPSEAAIAATRRMWSEGFHPMKQLRRSNYRKYKKVCAARGEKRRKLEAHEKWLLDMGMRQQTRLHRPYTAFTRKQICLRYSMLKLGYILGDMRECMGERYVIYFDDETKRSMRKEENARNVGFEVIKIRC